MRALVTSDTHRLSTAVTNIFFHIGLHKTATSWFQQVLFPRIDGIRVLKPESKDEIDMRVEGSKSLIVSWEALSGSISPRKPPGFNRQRLLESLNFIEASAPQAGIIIGFREHQSWLQAALAQKAKYKRHVDRHTYVQTFSPEDLSWCGKLETITASFPSAFPFLYEEIIQNPAELIGDLCRFMGKDPPSNLDELLTARRNPSPRSSIGQTVSRSLCSISPRHKGWTRLSHRIGAWLDRYAPASEAAIDAGLARDLQQDWIRLVHLVSKLRGRDLTGFGEKLSGYSPIQKTNPAARLSSD
jgi:hypothetical protein